MIRFVLYQENRCFGNQTEHKRMESQYVMKDATMSILLDFIKTKGNTTKAYTIIKMVDGQIQQRRLVKVLHRLSYRVFGDITTTWSRFYYHPTHKQWKETNYRYQDEKIGL